MMYDIKVVQTLKRVAVVRQIAPNLEEAKRLALKRANEAFSDPKGRNKKWSEYNYGEAEITSTINMRIGEN